MNSWLEFCGLWLADFYLAATIVLAIAVLLFAVLRQPARRMAVAWGSLVGLLVASGLCLAPSRPRLDLHSLFTRTHTRVAESEPPRAPMAPLPVVETPPRTEKAELDFDRFEESQAPAEQSARTEAWPSEPVALEPVPAATEWVAEWGPRFVAVAVWSFLAGGLAMASWLIIGVVRASRLVRQSAPASGACCEELRKIAGPAARLPRLRINPRLAMPVATGTARPAILLPEGFAASGSRNALKAVLAHEWTHIKNGDLWLLAFDRVLLTLLWAHPLYWWTRRRIRTNQELLADAAAASQIGPADYAALLVEWARKLAAHRGLTALTAVGIWERPAALEQRVTEILNRNHAAENCSGRVCAALLVCLAGLGLIATSLSLRPPRAESALAAEPSASPPIAQTPSPISTLEASATAPAMHVSPGANEIRVTCVDADKRPIAGAIVSLYRIDYDTDRQEKLKEATTNRDGQFVFADLSPVNGRIWNPRPYLIAARREGRASNAGRGKPGQSIELLMPKPASLTGTVTDPEGKPIADALVSCGTLWPGDDPIAPIEGFRCVKSNSKGEFTIRDLPEYQYIPRRISTKTKLLSAEFTLGPPALRVQHPGYVGQFINYTKIPSSIRALLTKGTPLTGRVIDDRTGKPAAHVYVFIQETHGQNLERWVGGGTPVETDADGRYRFDAVPAGIFNIMFAGGAPGLTAAAIVSFNVPGGQHAEAPPLRLIPGTIVKGRVIDDATGQPVHRHDDEYLDIQIRGASRPVNSAAVEVAEVSNNGTFEIRLPPGTHSFNLRTDNTGETFLPVSSPGWQNVPRSGELQLEFRVQRVKPPKSQTGQAAFKDSRQSASAEPANAAEPHVARDEVAGKCLDQNKAPVRGVQVSLYLANFSQSTRHFLKQTITDASGQFDFKQLPPAERGRFVVLARRDGLATIVRTVRPLKNYLNLSMRRAVVAKGTVRDQHGKPVAGALVDFGSGGILPVMEGVHSARTNANGEFIVGDLDEFHYLRETAPPGWRGGWAVAGPRSMRVTHPDFVRARVSYTELPGQFDIMLSGSPGSIEGQVVSVATGKPAADVLVRMRSAQKSAVWDFARTDADGRYRFQSLPDESYDVWVNNAPYDEGAVPIKSLAVHGGQATRAPVLRLVKGGVIKGRVIDDRTGRPAAGITILLQGIMDQIGPAESYWQETKTNGNGEYQFAAVPTGKFNVLDMRDRADVVGVAIDSLEVRANQVVTSPPLRLIPGCLIKGRIIEDTTGKQLTLRDGEHLDLQGRSAARPRSGAAVDGTDVRKDGTFEIRLPPGNAWLAIRGSTKLSPGGLIFDTDGNSGSDLLVPESGELNVEYHVRRDTPPKTGAAALPPRNETLAERETESTKVADQQPVVNQQPATGEIGGFCVGDADSRISGAEVSLYIQHTDFESRSHRFIASTTSNAEGRFAFQHVPPLQSGPERYFLVARRQGFATAIGFERQHDRIDVKLHPAVPVKGTVKDEQGQPIAGAVVRPYPLRAEHMYPEGVFTTQTDAGGDFLIADAAEGWPRWFVIHTDYLSGFFDVHASPGPVAVTLKKAGIVEGQVVIAETGQPAAGVLVGVQGLGYDSVHRMPQRFLLPRVTTDANGRYRLGHLPSRQVALAVVGGPDGSASAGIDTIDVHQGQTVQAPVIRLTKGGLVSGKLIDNLRNKPESVDEDVTIPVAVVRGAAADAKPVIENVHVRRDGAFHVWLPPGKNSVYLAGGPFFAVGDAAEGIGHDRRELDVQPGQEYAVEFRVVRIGRVRTTAIHAAPTQHGSSSAKPRKEAAPEKRSENVKPSFSEVLGYLPAHVSEWLGSRPQTDRDRMQITVEQTVVRTGECRFFPLVGQARLQERVFKCSVALDKVPHADAPLDIQETLKAPLVFYMQQNHLVPCKDSLARR